jgi:uncharacterized protein
MERVTFPNKDITVVGNLFMPSDFNSHRKYAAIVITHPFGGVKEQTSGLYAKKLAEQGFITLAFDASYQGESGGEPRYMEIPQTRVEDIRCAVDFLTTHPNVDEERIGALGICAGGGYTLSATQTEMRIKAAATISAFDLGSARREGVGGAIPYEERVKRLMEVGKQRTREARGEPTRYVSFLPETREQAATNPSQLYREGYDYYCEIARHPSSTGKYVFTSLGLQMAFFPFEQIETISPRPILMIAGSAADTLYFSKIAYDKAKEPKELFTIPGATHIDLYYKPEFVSQIVATLMRFFEENL